MVTQRGSMEAIIITQFQLLLSVNYQNEKDRFSVSVSLTLNTDQDTSTPSV